MNAQEGKIYERIASVQSDVEFIGKDKQVQSGGSYKYRGVDQVLNTLHPLFSKHKIFAVPEVLEILEREQRKTSKGNEVLYQVLKIRYTFYTDDGSFVSAVVVGEAMDSGDKVSNKCMSVAYKYACFQVLSIPTEETCADPDDENQALSEKKSSPEQKKSGLSLSYLRDIGIQDVGGMSKYLGKKFGKPINELDEEETREAKAWLETRVRVMKEAEKIRAPWEDHD